MPNERIVKKFDKDLKLYLDFAYDYNASKGILNKVENLNKMANRLKIPLITNYLK